MLRGLRPSFSQTNSLNSRIEVRMRANGSANLANARRVRAFG